MQVDTKEMIRQEVLENTGESEIKGEDLKEIIETIPSLNFIEAMNLKQSISNELENLKMMKETIESINNLNEDPMAKQIMSENELDDNEYKFDSKTFMNEYNNTVAELENIENKLNEKIEEYGDEEKNTTFLTNQLIESIDKNIKRIEESDNINKDYEINTLITHKNIYLDRGNLDFIKLKVSNKAAIKKWRKSLTNNQSLTIKKSIKILTKHFNKAQLYNVEEYLAKNFKSDFAAVLFLTHMANIMASESNSGKYAWVKVLFMNILDIKANIFDYNGIDVEDYENNIIELSKFYI